MSVFDYINKRKEQHQARREAIQTARHEDKQEALIKITEQRKKLQKRVDTSEALQGEKAKLKNLKVREFKESMAGKIVNKMSEKIREGKAQGNVFTGQGPAKQGFTGGQLNPIFHGASNSDIFTKTEDPFKEMKKKGGKPKSLF